MYHIGNFPVCFDHIKKVSSPSQLNPGPSTKDSLSKSSSTYPTAGLEATTSFFAFTGSSVLPGFDPPGASVTYFQNQPLPALLVEEDFRELGLLTLAGGLEL
jgi:hypothetical protein